MRWEWPHSIPVDDDFEHEETMKCPCRPYFSYMPRLGNAIVHQRMDIEVPDTFPESWVVQGKE